MTSPGRQNEIRAIWERANDSLAAAQVLLDSGHPDVAAARAYYAAFYAACALLLSEGKEYSRHGSVIGAIHKDFVRTRRLSGEQGRVLGWLFELRGLGDYGETRHVSEGDARESIPAARQFLDACRELLRANGLEVTG